MRLGRKERTKATNTLDIPYQRFMSNHTYLPPHTTNITKDDKTRAAQQVEELKEEIRKMQDCKTVRICLILQLIIACTLFASIQHQMRIMILIYCSLSLSLRGMLRFCSLWQAQMLIIQSGLKTHASSNLAS